MAPSAKHLKPNPASATTRDPNNDAGHEDAASYEAEQPTSLEDFALLPHEIKALIINLACSRTATSPSASPSSTTSHASAATHPPTSLGKPTCSALPLIDGATALSLILVSRSLYALVAPVIWESVWLTRPSQVASFHSAIAARPQLGRLVKDLHVGPDDRLPESWWPLAERDSQYGSTTSSQSSSAPVRELSMRSSLDTAKDSSLRPDWSTPDEDWILDRFPDDCGRRAVYDALTVVQSALDLNLLNYNATISGQPIVSEAWTTRLFEAQAALDLYLMALRRIDDNYESSKPSSLRRCDCMCGSCPLYPRLALTGAAMACEVDDSDGSAAGQPLVLSRHQLIHHLARRGSITDRLDHPLLFNRSGLELLERGSDFGSDRWRRSDKLNGMAEDFADLFSPEDGRGAVKGRIPSPTLCEVLDPTLPNTSTIGSILTLVRSILSFTPSLTNLSLTGFLDRAVCGNKPTASSLRRLRHLTVGPPPSAWFAPLRLDWLRHLESLRVCGVEVQDDEAESINELPDLRLFSWSMAAKWDDEKAKPGFYTPSLLEVFHLLRGDSKSAAAALAGVDDASSSSSSQDHEASSLDSDFDEAAVTLFELRLHPSDVELLFKAAPSDAVREAWRKGRVACPGDESRILLVDSSAAMGRWAGVSCTTVEELYKEGREWWEKHAALRGRA